MSEAYHPAWSAQPARSTAWFSIGLALVCVPIAAFRLATDGSPRVTQAAVFMAVLCGVLVWRSVHALRGAQSVIWSTGDLTGPAGAFGPLVHGPKVTLALSGIARVGHAGWGVWFAEAWNGDRVHWTEGHEGHEDLLGRLAARVSVNSVRRGCR